MNNFRDEIRDLFSAVEPDEARIPYVLDAREISHRGDWPTTIGGCAVAAGAVRFASEIRASQPWRGFGPAAIVIDCARITRPEDLHAIALHEVAHTSAFAPVDDLAAVVSPHVLSELSSEPVPLSYSPMRPWADHCPRFARLLWHAIVRARRAGWANINLRITYHTGLYGSLPPLESQAATLGTEPDDLAELSLFEVARVEPPEEFSRMESFVLARAEREWLARRSEATR